MGSRAARAHVNGVAQLVDPDAACLQIEEALKQYPSFRPRLNTDSSAVTYSPSTSNGKQQQPVRHMLCLYGTLPIVYLGAAYQVPLEIMIPPAFPYVAPFVYVRPTAWMCLDATLPQNADANATGVDPLGRVLHPVLRAWDASATSLATLLNALQLAFAARPPVYAARSMPVTSPPNPPNMRPPAPTAAAAAVPRPAPAQVARPYVPAHLTRAAIPYIPQTQQQPLTSLPPMQGPRQNFGPVSYQPGGGGGGGAYPARGAVVSPTSSILNSCAPSSLPPAIDPVALRNSKLVAQIHSCVAACGARLQSECVTEIKQLLVTLDDICSKRRVLACARADVMCRSRVIGVTTQACKAALDNIVAALDRRKQTKPLDNDSATKEIDCAQIVAPSRLHQQLNDAIIEDRAITDTIYLLNSSFAAEAISHSSFLKLLQSFARDQFIARRTILQCRVALCSKQSAS